MGYQRRVHGAQVEDAPFFKTLAVPPADHNRIAIGMDKADALGILGFEGSFYTQTSDGWYHFLSAGRLPAPEGWHYQETDIHMRLDHWISGDGRIWGHDRKLHNPVAFLMALTDVEAHGLQWLLSIPQ